MTTPDPTSRLDDPHYPALTMSQAAELLGVLQPFRSAGGHRRYSRHQLALAARVRTLLDDGHSLASAGTIVGLEDQLATARADADSLRSAAEALRADVARLTLRPTDPPGSARPPLGK